MIAKKNRKVDLEKKRFAFFQIGLIVSGSLCLAAFEYASVEGEKQVVFLEDEREQILGDETFDYFEEEIVEKKKETVYVQSEVIDNVTIVDKKLKEGMIVKSSDGKIVFDDGDGVDYGEFELEGEEEILDFVEKEPEFIGGLQAMYDFIGKNVVYPSMEAEMGLGGTAIIQFVVNTDGSICQVVDSSQEGDVTPALSNEAIRVVRSMPKWIPGEQAGKKVRVRYTLPIRFIAPR